MYHRYEGKRLPNVMNTMAVSSIAKCAQLCYETDGCLVINVILNNGVICELSAGLRNEIQMDENASYLLLIRGTFEITM